mmetsp:Transcript_33538/g.53477  ORF Transcript_33538/g.53477 Transcript_33538/m.53477 type:complete len:501 (+) Transcript_33538:35-1537(+)
MRRSSSTVREARADRKASIKQRSHSVAAQVLSQSLPSHPLPVLRVRVATEFDVQVKISLDGVSDRQGLPAVCRAGSNQVVTMSAPCCLTAPNASRKGSVVVAGFQEAVPFVVASSGGSVISVGAKGRCKQTLLQSCEWDWRNAAEKPTEGRALDVESSGSELEIRVRPQTVMELKRCCQMQALHEAMRDQDYDTLRAQVTKARMASVDMDQIALGEARLKELKDLGLHVSEGCDKVSIREKMDWSKVTSKIGSPGTNEECSACANCPCNTQENPGEVLEVVEGAIQNILEKFGPDGDRLLFESLVDAALAVEDGCIWKSGGKFIFSEFSRNQSCIALERMLLKYEKHKCNEMMKHLHEYTEKRYNGFVTAIQVNIHPECRSYHDQHRDIYSQKQTAGPNCTCQFQECIGTVCYTLGSSRKAQLQTMTDNMSSISPCGENCKGRTEHVWLHSGSSMYFNVEWNKNHTHGVPPCDYQCGPRISLAFLLAPKPSLYGVCTLGS